MDKNEVPPQEKNNLLKDFVQREVADQNWRIWRCHPGHSQEGIEGM